MRNRKNYLLFIILTLVALMFLGKSADAALTTQTVTGYTVVVDSHTNLMWLADANYAKTSGYDFDGYLTWTDAMNYVDSLTIGGYTDWRLPSIQSDTRRGYQSG